MNDIFIVNDIESTYSNAEIYARWRLVASRLPGGVGNGDLYVSFRR